MRFQPLFLVIFLSVTLLFTTSHVSALSISNQEIRLDFSFNNGNNTIPVTEFESSLEPSIEAVTNAQFGGLNDYIYESNWSASRYSETGIVEFRLNPTFTGITTHNQAWVDAKYNILLYEIQDAVQEEFSGIITWTFHLSWGTMSWDE